MSLSNSKERLLELALQYSSAEEFKTKDYPKYLIAKKRRLLRIAFPPIKVPRTIKGIFFLRMKEKIVYIGNDHKDCEKAIRNSTKKFDNYWLYNIYSSSDIDVLTPYLINFHRPRYNDNISGQRLSFKLYDLYNYVGKPIKGTKDELMGLESSSCKDND